MSKAPSPLLGYNNNVRHKSRVFHIQTEDSGVKHPHIITHLFMDGGRILKSIKKSYAEHLGTEGLSDVVRQMMKEQHKAMFIALRGGQFDHLVEAASDSQPPRDSGSPPAEASAPAAEAAAPAEISVPAEVSVPVAAKKTEEPRMHGPASMAAPLSGLDAREPPSAPETVRMMSPPISDPAKSAPSLFEAVKGPPSSGASIDSSGEELTLDIDALETNAGPAEAPIPLVMPAAPPVAPPPAQAPPPPPPPSAESLRELAPSPLKKRADSFRFRAVKETRATAALLSTSPRTGQAPVRPWVPPSPLDAPRAEARIDLPKAPEPTPPPPTVTPTQTAKSVVPPPPAAEGRYAPARPAAIFGHARPQQGSSIFGEDLISDKSLDEVILSYLAEDLETDKK